ncbi:two-component regulator propeller domain-containing protein [Spirosoma sp. KNUC1025]|uniref:ligand-binding sensor domain-containing protein n=1 Tax=Spirosoma sp. KNUC1025 TaxID=2894082 RepID=UPI001E365B5A|nr:two-component regulator propeller domain-containing protein [Spirosoma sp. KNUC1025]UFH57677.1 histidine kinase [Spirosoma sp. KNUC1025]
MKFVPLYAFVLLVAGYSSSKALTKNDLPKDTIKAESKQVPTAYGPSHITRTLKQDRKGNIWMATFGGVYRYDGKSFTNVTSQVSSAHFFSVLEDRKGNFWFSTVGEGVYYYDGKSFQQFTTKEGLASDQVLDIYEDKAGTIWFGTGGGATRYDGKSFRTYKMNEGLHLTPDERRFLKDDNDVNSIIEDKTGKFWFATRGHAYLYDGKTFTLLTHEGTPFINVRTIIEDKKGAIWLGGLYGLWRYDGSRFTNVSERGVAYVYEDKKGVIWTSSLTNWGWSLFRYDGETLSTKNPTVTKVELDSDDTKTMLFGILEATNSHIWFGSGGAYRYDGKSITDFKKKEIN